MNALKLSLVCALSAAVSASAWAKLPAPTDEAKAKAAEAAAKAAYGTKVADYQLCKATDRVAAAYLASVKKEGKALTPTPTPACNEPGVFAYVAADAAKPLEAAGAHSPAKTASTPPSTTTPAAEQNPAKK